METRHVDAWGLMYARLNATSWWRSHHVFNGLRNLELWKLLEIQAVSFQVEFRQLLVVPEPPEHRLQVCFSNSQSAGPRGWGKWPLVLRIAEAPPEERENSFANSVDDENLSSKRLTNL